MNNKDKIIQELNEIARLGAKEETRPQVAFSKGKLTAYTTGIVDSTKGMIDNFVRLAEKGENMETLGSLLVDIERLLDQNLYLKEDKTKEKKSNELGKANPRDRNYLKVKSEGL